MHWSRKYGKERQLYCPWISSGLRIRRHWMPLYQYVYLLESGYFLSGLFLKILFSQWAQGILSSCPLSLQIQANEPLSLLTAALTELSMAYALPIPTLIPRPALFLFGYTASSLYLLEHAIWSHTNGEAERETDIEVFTRWVAEGGLTGAVGM